MCHGLEAKWIVAETEARLAGLPKAAAKTKDRVPVGFGLMARALDWIAGWMRKEVADV